MLNRNKLGQKKLLLVGAAAIAVCNALIAHSLLSGHATPSAEALEQGRLHRVGEAPVFTRRVYVVENAQTVRPWGWYASALAAAASH